MRPLKFLSPNREKRGAVFSSRQAQKLALAISASLVMAAGSVLAVAGNLKPGSVSRDFWLKSSAPDVANAGVRLRVTVTEVDPFDNGNLTITATPELQNQWGTTLLSGSLAKSRIAFDFTNTSGNGFQDTRPGTIIGSLSSTVNLQNTRFGYPFDEYRAYWTIFVTDLDARATPSVALVEDSQILAGLNIRARQLDYRGDGSIRGQRQNGGPLVIEWTIQRSTSSKVAVLAIALLLIVGAGSSLAVTVAIVLRHRPPSLGALGWLAAFLFALFEIRKALPGNPPSGDLFDLYLFFPSLIVIGASTVVNIFVWVRRDDWDLENPRNSAASAEASTTAAKDRLDA